MSQRSAMRGHRTLTVLQQRSLSTAEQAGTQQNGLQPLTGPALSPRYGSSWAIGSRPRRRCASSMAAARPTIAVQPPEAVAFVRSTEEVAAYRRALRRAPRAGGGVRCRHLARRPCRRARRWRLARPDADERSRGGASRGSRRHGAGRGHPQAAQRAPARHRPVLPDRSRRRRNPRRHGGHARVGNQRRPLRHDEGERAGPDRRPGRRAGASAPAAVPASRRPATISPACSWAPKGRSGSSPRSPSSSTACPRRSPPRSAASRASTRPSRR